MDWVFEKSPAEIAGELKFALGIADSQAVLEAVRKVFIDDHLKVLHYSRLPMNWPKSFDTSGEHSGDEYRSGFNAGVHACTAALKAGVIYDASDRDSCGCTSAAKEHACDGGGCPGCKGG